MIKKIIKIAMFFMLFSIVATAQEIKVESADIAFWELKDGLERYIADIRCPELQFWYHSDLVLDKFGNVMTATPEKGCDGKSDIENRIDSEKWSRLLILRNPSLTESQRDEIVETAWDTECNYDWVGFYFHWIDFLWSCDMVPGLRNLLPDDYPDYNCLSFSAYCSGFTHPHAITPWEMIATPGWVIIGEYEF